ncbi:MAG: MBL fold metallo-hydrolase, partial [Caldimonas sp.]
FYRMMLGAFEITALSDGVFDLDTGKLLTNTTPGNLRRLLEESFHHDAVPTSVNAYLINTGEQLILVDTGAAQRFGPTLGRMPANLVASGYRPEQVDALLITHMHPDHIGGMVANGKMLFPNAAAFVDRREAEYWLGDSALQHAADDRKNFFEGAVASMTPYSRAGQLQTFEGPAELLAGMRAIPAPGHTPGHTMYSVQSQGQRLVFWGDLTEIASVQFVQGNVATAFDGDGPESARQRDVSYADAAAERYLVAGSHLPFPGIGHVRKDGTGYAWVPIDYEPIR